MAIIYSKPRKKSPAEEIRPAPGLSHLVKLDGGCIDSMAALIVDEALEYAINVAARKMENVSKVFPSIKEGTLPLDGDSPALSVIVAVRQAIWRMPRCEPGKAPSKPPERETPKPEMKTEIKPVPVPKAAAKIEKKEESEAEAIVGQAWDMIPVEKRVEWATRVGLEGQTGSKKWRELTTIQKMALIKGQALTPIKAAVIEVKKEEEKKRTVPDVWTNIEFKGKKYDNLSALARELGIKVKGAHTVPEAFERSGYKLATETGSPVLAKGSKIIVTKIGLTPAKYQVESIPAPQAAPAKKPSPYGIYGDPSTWAKVKNKEGHLIRYEVEINGKGVAVPKELWPPPEQRS